MNTAPQNDAASGYIVSVLDVYWLVCNYLSSTHLFSHEFDIKQFITYAIKYILDNRTPEEDFVGKTECRTMLLKLDLDLPTIIRIEHDVYICLINLMDGALAKLNSMSISGIFWDLLPNYDLILYYYPDGYHYYQYGDQ